jgi:hypothetical protein
MVSPAEAAVTAAWMVAWSHPDEHTVLVAACAAPATVSSAIAAIPTADMSMSRSRLIPLVRTSIIEVLLSAARPPLYSQRSIGFASFDLVAGSIGAREAHHICQVAIPP